MITEGSHFRVCGRKDDRC